MSTPPQARLAHKRSMTGLSSSPSKGIDFYQDQIPDPSELQDDDTLNFVTRQDEEDADSFFRSTMEGSSTQSFYDPSTQLDSDTGLVVPISRNDIVYNNQNQMLQYPPRYEMSMHQYGPSYGSSSSMYYTQAFDAHNRVNEPQRYDQYQQQPQQQQQLQQHQQQQSNLYPAMMMSPTTVEQDIPSGLHQIQQLPQSISATSISSDELRQHFYTQQMPSSQSDHSLASSMSYQTASATPRRPLRRNSNNATTPGSVATVQHTPKQQSSIKRTPSTRITKSQGHRRTRSRLSVDATGVALLSLQPNSSTTSNGRSPNTNTGTNPFYTPTVYQSPAHESPVMTPLSTPQLKRENNSFVSPMMLMNQQGQISACVTPQEESLSSDVFAEAANLTLKMASRFAYAPQPVRNSEHRHTRSLASHTPFPTITSHTYLTDPDNVEADNDGNDDDIDNHNRPPSTTSLSTPRVTHKRAQSISALPSTLSRSESAATLASIGDNAKLIPPEITTYDILTPRKNSKALQKSQSSTDIPAIAQTKKGTPKKMHYCPLCNAVFQRPEHVKRHMRSHSSEKPFTCDEPNCGKRFNRGDNMKAHLRKIHGRHA